MCKRNDYQICSRCVMDNSSDATISFDSKGFCNYCTEALIRKEKEYFPNKDGETKMLQLVSFLKEKGKGKKYDCLMGISGGLDSSYLAYLGAVKYGLRILAVHIDDGFDTDLAQENIRKLCEKANIKLIIERPDAKSFNDLTKSFMRASVPNLAIPQDNVLFACLYKYARKYKLHYFLSGGNYALESILQRGNTYRAFDKTHIMAIHRKFGDQKLNHIPILSDYRRFWDQFVLHIKTMKPLNYIDYNKDAAILELKEYCDFNYYKAKHLENVLTKFIQLYWFKDKFGVDKRRSHLSSLIVSNQMTREAALKELENPMYDKKEMEEDINFILMKLNLSPEEFNDILHRAPRQHNEYPTDKFYDLLKRFIL